MGLNAGISPGPLMALVVMTSVQSGLPGGLRVALAPIITDAPIIALVVFVIGQLPPDALRWIGSAGGLVVIWMGMEVARSAKRAELPDGGGESTDPLRELRRGVVVNALNPNPYLFWATVGGPALVNGWRTSPWHALAFLLPFYTLLVGSMTVLAWVASHQVRELSVTWYRRLLTGCGLLMLVMGGFLIWQTWTSSWNGT